MARVQRHLVVLLLLALPAYGFSGVLAELIGAQHRHRQAAPVLTTPAVLEDVRRAPLHPGIARTAHSHNLWQRHHHARADATVQALDAGAADAPAGEAQRLPAGATALSPGAWSAVSVGEPRAARLAWPRVGPSAAASMAVAPPERPPKA